MVRFSCFEAAADGVRAAEDSGEVQEAAGGKVRGAELQRERVLRR